MNRISIGARAFRSVVLSAVFMSVFQFAMPPDTAHARRGRDGDNRSEHYGVIKSRPQKSMEGVWNIGGQNFTVTAGTEFNQTEGKLTVGTCAKVHIRNGRVHEIDSEPMHNCK